MVEVAYQSEGKVQKNVEIVVHVDEELGETQRGELIDYLTSTDGVNAADFCPLRWHLMLVQYDRDRLTSQDVIRRVNSKAIHAKLIGPI